MPETHFEVLGQQSGGWTLHRVAHDQKNAIESANSYKRELNLLAVKVLQVTYDDAGQSFSDKEVYFDGHRSTAGKTADLELILPICQKSEDLYLPEARRAIHSVLRKPLEGWGLTVLELLYGAEYVQRLNDTGQILQGAVQKVAISQIQKTGQKVNERVLELYNLTNEILQDLKTRRQISDLGLDQDEDLKVLYDKVRAGTEAKKDFFIALTHYFKKIKSLDEKFEKTLAFIKKYDEDDILFFLDHFLADFLISGDRIKSLLGEERNLGEGMLSLIDLIKGKAEMKRGQHRAIKRINGLMAENRLPVTRKSLVHMLRSTLQGNASFDKEDALSNILYHRKIAVRMQLGGDKFVGGSEGIDALRERCEKMTGSVTVANLLDGYDHPLDRVDRLLDVAAGFVGDANLRAIGNYIIPILQSEFNRQTIISGVNGGFPVLERLSLLQRKTRKPGLPDYFQKRILLELDELAMEGVKQADLLNKLANSTSDPLDTEIALLQVIFRGEVTRPKVLTEFKSFARKSIMSEKFMKRLETAAAGGGADTAKMQAFYQLLEDTRIDLKN